MAVPVNDGMVVKFANANVSAGRRAWMLANNLTGNDSQRTFMEAAGVAAGKPFNDLMIAYCLLP